MLVTVADIQNHIGRSGANLTFGTEDTTVVTQLIKSVTESIEGYCDRDFESGTNTERVTSYGAQNLVFRGYPVATVTSITDMYLESDDTEEDYDVYAEGVILERGTWKDGHLRFQAVYTFGYTSLTVPNDLKLAIINEVMSEFHLSRAEPKPTENISGFERSIELSKKTKELIEHYRR